MFSQLLKKYHLCSLNHNSPTGDEYAKTDKNIYFQRAFYFKFNSLPKFLKQSPKLLRRFDKHVSQQFWDLC